MVGVAGEEPHDSPVALLSLGINFIYERMIHMEEMLALVSTREELISNIKRFNADLPNDDYLQSLLSL